MRSLTRSWRESPDRTSAFSTFASKPMALSLAAMQKLLVEASRTVRAPDGICFR